MKKLIVAYSILAAYTNNGYAAEGIQKNTPLPISSVAKAMPPFSVFPIGINNGKRNAISSALVRGAEDGKAAVNLEQWLVPLEVIASALSIKVSHLDGGQLELRSAEIITHLAEQELHKDKELGMALSVAEITRLFNIEVSFDISQYALVLVMPTPTVNSTIEQTETKKVISFDGLKTLQPDSFNFSAVSQQLRISGQQKNINYSGDLLAVGNVDHGSWYVDVNQQTMEKPESWRLQELQYYWKTDDNDYVIGSQPTFWQNNLGGDFWGVTLLKRSGFNTNALQQSSSGFDPVYRRTNNIIGRTITGEAKPNTLVRLVKRFSNQFIAEVFVN
jgi:hypothetical protein